MTQKLQDILKSYKLRNTQNRTSILGLFLEYDGAMSHADIEERLGSDIDRVTIYRTLKSFLDHGLLHKVLDDVGGAKYALCSMNECHPHEHHHNHVHFKCVECGLTQCMENIEIPNFSLPSGYQSNEMDLLIQGKCSNCNK